ncbi:hypothetical protein CJF32_00004872 [Rutstroemia sp. NJR-2017a WRK4]|nr:hypothetical protein CJF32_00004872 [Rutstroemia sp. NJR-2017a WRK4]
MPRPKKAGAPEPKKRSRNGCWPCKARKVKCDEARPTCVNCSKQGETCDYSIRLNWDGRGKKKPQDGVGAGQINFSATSPIDTAPKDAGQLSTEPFTAFQSFAPGSTPVVDHNARDTEYPKQTTETTMIDPALMLAVASPTAALMPEYHSGPGQLHLQHPQSFERYHSGVSVPPVSPMLVDAPNRSQEMGNELEDPGTHSSAASTSNKSVGFLDIESPISTPPYYRSAIGTPAADASLDRPSKRVKHDSLTPSSSMLPPSQPRTLYNDEVQASSSQLPSPRAISSNFGVDSYRSRRPPQGSDQLRRLSVNSLLSGPPEGQLPAQSPGSVQNSDHESQGWSPSVSDVYRDTETWGVDRGFIDLDIGKNDDANATSGMSPKAVRQNQELIIGSPGIASPVEFGFGMESSDTALDVRYYDKPVPICIPRALEPLPTKLLENPMNLLHHFLNHTAGCLIPHNCSSNPFRSILPQMAVRDDDLLHLLLAYSASHRARLLRQPEPATRIALWVKDIFPNLRHALDDPTKIITDANLATVIMLASLEIISPKAFGVAVPWQKHLELARQMVAARGGAHRMQTISRKDKVSSFLWSWFAYLDVLGSLSGGQNISSAWMLDYDIEDDAGDYQIDCILGFTSRCVRILAKVAALARQCDAQRIGADSTIQANWQPSDDVVSRAQKLEADLLESRRHRAKPCTHMQSKSEAEYQWDTLEVAATNEAFHSAGLIHLHRRILGKPSEHEDVQHAVREILGSFNKVRKGSSAEACLLFPMFTAGCDLQDEKQRSDILERIIRVEKFGMTQVHNARKLMEKVWETGKPWETLVGGEFFG